MDYGLEIPEVNSGRMWAGIGSAPLVTSGMAWQALAAELGSASAVFSAILAELTGASWMGPSSAAMLEAAAPFAAWLLAHAMQAEQSAIAAIGAANAFETARAGVIHPAVIAENRTELATLIATNFMGVNAPAIAANEAEYSEFWAQDASILYGYAGEMSGITGSLVPFVPAAPTTDPAGLAAQAAATGTQSAGQAGSTVSSQMSSMPSGMGSMSSVMGAPMQAASSIPQMLKGLSGGGGGIGQQFSSFLPQLLGMLPQMMGGLGTGAGSLSSLGSLSTLGNLGSAPAIGSGAVASMGRATTMGQLSAPARYDTIREGWAEAESRVGTSPLKSFTPEGVVAQEEPNMTPAAGMRGGMMPMMAGMGQQATTVGNTRRYLPGAEVYGRQVF
jgi:PPE-repeat protein